MQGLIKKKKKKDALVVLCSCLQQVYGFEAESVGLPVAFKMTSLIP